MKGPNLLSTLSHRGKALFLIRHTLEEETGYERMNEGKKPYTGADDNSINIIIR
jgi:hypothetical protein